MSGIVYLVGAGPGDPRLITWRGLECLRRAEVVVYDHLIDNSILEEASAGAKKVYVGKSAGNHSLTQEEINELLVAQACQGRVVVRLKGGDPFVFGRGGEEAKALAEAGVPFSIVPGVSAAIAAPAYAGIPVTHRDYASSFSVVTGREDIMRGISRINWERVATGADTIVFMMAVANLPFIVSQLLSHGRQAETPVAIVANGTRPSQVTITSTLGEVVEAAKNRGITPPAVLIVGDVVRLRENLAWFENRPLFGRRVLVTRAKPQADVLKDLLVEAGAEVIEHPLIEIVPVNPEALQWVVTSLGSFDWVLFTSVNGVDALFASLKAMHLDSRAFHRAKVGAIGPATAEALRQKGIEPDFIPSVYTSDGILNGLKEYDIGGKDILLIRANIADEYLANGLKSLGARVHAVVAYHTRLVRDNEHKLKGLFNNDGVDVVTFTSASTVRAMLQALDAEALLLNRVTVACIGPVTAEAARKAGVRVDIIAKEHTMGGMVQAITSYYGGNS